MTEIFFLFEHLFFYSNKLILLCEENHNDVTFKGKENLLVCDLSNFLFEGNNSLGNNFKIEFSLKTIFNSDYPINHGVIKLTQFSE